MVSHWYLLLFFLTVFRYLLFILKTETLLEPLTRKWSPQSDEDHGSDRVSQADGAAEVRGEVSDDGRQEADDGDGHDEARPAVPVLCWWHEGKQNLPEDTEYVHEVVEAVGQTLLLSLLLVSITWMKETQWSVFKVKLRSIHPLAKR